MPSDRGSTPLGSTKKNDHPFGWSFFYQGIQRGVEPIAEQQSGGLLLTPVQTLVATSILPAAKCISMTLGSTKKNDHPFGWSFFYQGIQRGVEPIAEQQSGGLLLTPVQTLVATSILPAAKCISMTLGSTKKNDHLLRVVVLFIKKYGESNL